MHEDIRNFHNGQYKYWITCSRYIRSDRRILRKYCNSMCKYLNLWSLHWLRSDTFRPWFVYFVIFFRDSRRSKIASFTEIILEWTCFIFISNTDFNTIHCFKKWEWLASWSGRILFVQYKLVSERTERDEKSFQIELL